MRAAVAASRTIPIVGDNLEDDPVADGLVASIGRPGGNLTGFFLNLPDLTAKWLQLIREILPGARRVAVLWDATTNSSQVRAVTTAAQAAMVELRVLEVRRSTEYAGVLRTSLKERPQALLQLSVAILQFLVLPGELPELVLKPLDPKFQVAIVGLREGLGSSGEHRSNRRGPGNHMNSG